MQSAQQKAADRAAAGAKVWRTAELRTPKIDQCCASGAQTWPVGQAHQHDQGAKRASMTSGTGGPTDPVEQTRLHVKRDGRVYMSKGMGA